MFRAVWLAVHSDNQPGVSFIVPLADGQSYSLSAVPQCTVLLLALNGIYYPTPRMHGKGSWRLDACKKEIEKSILTQEGFSLNLVASSIA